MMSLPLMLIIVAELVFGDARKWGSQGMPRLPLAKAEMLFRIFIAKPSKASSARLDAGSTLSPTALASQHLDILLLAKSEGRT